MKVHKLIILATVLTAMAPHAQGQRVEREVTVAVDSTTALAGTLLMPEESAPTTTVVVFITGSGSQDRDETVFGHPTFADIASYMADNGIGSLRCDDRSVGKSTGDADQATTLTFADDAATSVHWVRRQFPQAKVGVIGHSEGGTIAFKMAADSLVDFAVSIAGMAVTGRETLLAQNRDALTAQGFDKAQTAAVLTLLSTLFDEIATAPDSPAPSAVMTALRLNLNIPMPVVLQIDRTMQSLNPWLRQFIALDPSDWLKSVKIPLLAINGAKDCQVNAKANLDRIRQHANGNPLVETAELTGLNHLLLECQTGDFSEYPMLNGHVSGAALTLITDFIRRNTAQ